MHVCKHLHIYIYIYIYMYVYVFLSLSLSFSLSLFISIYIYICVYTHVRNIMYALPKYLQVSACMGSMMYVFLKRYPQVTTCLK